LPRLGSVQTVALLALLMPQHRDLDRVVQAEKYTWCEALGAPPLTRYVSNVFVVPTQAGVDLPALFGEAIKAAGLNQRPQELSCHAGFATREEATATRQRRLTGEGEVVMRNMPRVAVEWGYTGAAK
jgi:hypothetical protein